MSTPRTRSGAYPSTPQQPQSSPSRHGSPGQSYGSPGLRDISELMPSRSEPNVPLVPFTTVDAPSQRFYVAGFYTALLFWRLYDFYHLTIDESESLWLFMKWVSIDGIFLFGLPGLGIPWLEWSSATMTVLFLLHAVLDGILMFRIPIPLGTGIVSLTKVLYDREMAVSERRVKPADIINDPSLILGRQIIHILPEGSALLNPAQIPLCLDTRKSSSSIYLPLQINQTNPLSIELIRFDLDTNENETISISASQAKKLRREAERAHGRGVYDPLVLQYQVKKTGLYRLSKVIDETKLEVQTRRSEALVVACPVARLKSRGTDRCRGDLSDLSIEVEGTPPLKIKYRSGKDRVVSYQSIQPDDFVSPLVRQDEAGPLVIRGRTDLSWARSYKTIVPLNETLGHSGKWSYSIDEVTDVSGNKVVYAIDEEDSERGNSKSSHLEETLEVHDRPRIALQGCDVQHPLRVAKSQEVSLPIKFSSTGKGELVETEHKYTYLFTPYDGLSPSGEHSSDASLVEGSVKNTRQRVKIKEPGLYTFQSVSTPQCDGEVMEPASCLLINPPEPDLAIHTEPIADKCAGKPIGLRVDLSMTGSPPFKIQVVERKQGERSERPRWETFDGLRGHLEFKPETAGHHTYEFREISDKVYSAIDLRGKNFVFQQDVKPSVSAHFLGVAPKKRACIDEPAQFDVKLQGEGPWKLEYEVVHGGKRSKSTIKDINEEYYQLVTEKLTSGGEYSVVLASVTDKNGCKEVLQQEAKIFVRHQRPKASFGQIEKKRSILTLEGKGIKLPVRLSGEGPWTVTCQQTNGGQVTSKTHKFGNANDDITIHEPGNYELVSVHDTSCPGTVEESSRTFEVISIQRPKISIIEGPLLEKHDGKYIRKEVCEGQDDAFDVSFTGRPPFEVKYRENVMPEHGPASYRDQLINIPQSHTQVKLDTAKAGSYEYIFNELGDYNYEHNSKRHDPLIVQQRVNSRPSATFAVPGKVYSFCAGDTNTSAEEVVPITLTGTPPFTVDIEIKHNSAAGSASTKRASSALVLQQHQTLTIPNILTTTHDLLIPHHYLKSGTSLLSIRRVRDALGCERNLDSSTFSPSANNRVQISVHNPPSISPAEPARTDYCVGERLTYALTGVPPFAVHYTFRGAERRATSATSAFRRLAESAGNLTITGITDAASTCRARGADAGVGHTAVIHEMPRVRVSHGREERVDIHAGGEARIEFEFEGVPPFEFTYTRSENARHKGGREGRVLETRTLRSEGRTLSVAASEEGTYEVVAIADAHCSFSRPGYEALKVQRRPLALQGDGLEQKLLTEE